MHEHVINIVYVVASVLFIVGLKGLAHPRTAVRGNLIGAIAMLLAIVATLMYRNILSFEWILGGLITGSAIGAILAVKIRMTAMPELVALFNGFGGGASVLVAGAALLESGIDGTSYDAHSLQLVIATVASGIIGSVTFLGSLMALIKLAEPRSIKKILWKLEEVPGVNYLTALVFIGAVVLGVMVGLHPADPAPYWAMVGVACVLGVLLVIPIGGADMPVVVALLNSYSGLAAAATGFVLNNNVLIIAGSLVGASGLILTSIMCKAMNRSLVNVLFGGAMGAGTKRIDVDELYAGKVTSTSADELAMLLETARRVVIVPGYGMAVAQAQHAVRDLGNLLEDQGIEVEYAIHPVAGRMPGHMNVLLAEADIPYDKLKAMEDINSSFKQTDVVIVLGANDVVNPVAREEGNAISGMPILDVDHAQTVVIIKRSLSPGFAGVPNPLFAADNALMLFGDGKKVMLELVAAVKAAA